MKLNFDLKGNLLPRKKIELKVDDFKENFVDSFEVVSTRYEIFENHQQYIQDFKSEITPNFKQWINGSFVTNRLNPKDIDLVNLVDYETALEKYDLIKEKFINKESLKKYRIDAYFVRIYPKGHKDYSKTISDLLYWEHWFGYTKLNRARKRHPKGFVELLFNE